MNDIKKTNIEDIQQQIKKIKEKIKKLKEQKSIEIDENKVKELNRKIERYYRIIRDLRAQQDNYISFKQSNTTTSSPLYVGDFFRGTKISWKDTQDLIEQDFIEAENRYNSTFTLETEEEKDLSYEQFTIFLEKITILLPPKQKQYLYENLNNGLSHKIISEKHSVDKSVVSRTILRANKKIQLWVSAYQDIKYFEREDSTFNWKDFLEKNNNLFSKRQIKILLMIIEGYGQDHIAKKLSINKSTVFRTFIRINKKLQILNLIPIGNDSKMTIEEFSNLIFSNNYSSLKTSPYYFYYKNYFGERIKYHGLPSYAYVIAINLRLSKSVEEIAEKLKIPRTTADQIIRSYNLRNFIKNSNNFIYMKGEYI